MCRELAPEYDRAAQRLHYHKPRIPFGKINAMQEPHLATRSIATPS